MKILAALVAMFLLYVYLLVTEGKVQGGGAIEQPVFTSPTKSVPRPFLDPHQALHDDSRPPCPPQKVSPDMDLAKVGTEDYEKWLRLFDAPNKEQQLTTFHRNNLRVLQRGGRLKAVDLPRQTVLPATANQQFREQVLHKPTENVPHPEFLGYKPANFDAGLDGSAVNRNMRHLNFINPDASLI